MTYDQMRQVLSKFQKRALSPARTADRLNAGMADDVPTYIHTIYEILMELLEKQAETQELLYPKADNDPV